MVITLESCGHQRRVGVRFRRVSAVAGLRLAAEAIFVLLLQALLVHFLLELAPLILILFRKLGQCGLLLYLLRVLRARSAYGALASG